MIKGRIAYACIEHCNVYQRQICGGKLKLSLVGLVIGGEHAIIEG